MFTKYCLTQAQRFQVHPGFFNKRCSAQVQVPSFSSIFFLGCAPKHQRFPIVAAVTVVTRVASKVTNLSEESTCRAQGSDLQAEENAPTSGSCPILFRQRNVLDYQLVLAVRAYRWFGPRWRCRVFVCQEDVDQSTKTAPRGGRPVRRTAW